MYLEETLIRASGPISMVVGLALAIYLFRQEAARPRQHRWLAFLAIYIFTVIFFIAAARGVQAYLNWRVDSFDLNGNGMMEPTEPFGTYSYLPYHMIADTGRAMVFITAPILAPFFLVFSYALYRLLRFMSGLVKKTWSLTAKKTGHAPAHPALPFTSVKAVSW